MVTQVAAAESEVEVKAAVATAKPLRLSLEL
jgi:hypothetical protein